MVATSTNTSEAPGAATIRSLLLAMVFIFPARIGIAEPASDDNVHSGVARKLERSLLSNASKADKIGKTHSGYLERHRFRDIPVSLQEKSCYRFVAAAGPGQQDISLALQVEEREVASDRLSGTRPMIRWCAAATEKAVVRVSMYDGEGTFVMLVLGEKGGGAGSKKEVGGTAGDFTANRIRQLHTQFAKNLRPSSRVFQGNLSSGETVSHPVKLKGGHCYKVLGAGSISVRDLNIAIRDSGGGTVAEDLTKNSFPVIDSGVCPKVTSSHTLFIRMVSGSGLYSVQLFSD